MSRNYHFMFKGPKQFNYIVIYKRYLQTLSLKVCLQEFGSWHPAGTIASASWGPSSLDDTKLAVSVSQTDDVDR